MLGVLLQNFDEHSELPREVEATQINLDSADETLKQNAQRAYLEQYAPERIENDGGMLTLSLIAAHDEEVLEKRVELFQTTNELAEFMANKQDVFERRMHAWDIRMQNREAERRMDFMEKYGMKEELREHMCKNGARREHAEKAVKAYEEYSKLKRREINGELDEAGTQRLQNLEQSELVKFAEKHIEKLAKKFGLKDTREELAELAKSREASFMGQMRDLDRQVNGDEPTAEVGKSALSMTFTDVSQMLKSIAANPVVPVTETKTEKRADIAAPALVPA